MRGPGVNRRRQLPRPFHCGGETSVTGWLLGSGRFAGVSKHWHPDKDLTRVVGADDLARARQDRWPQGSTVGIGAIAALCLAVAAILYQAAGPRDIVEESVARR